MTKFAAAIAIASLIGSLVLAAKCYLGAETFFATLVQRHPELRKEFPLPGLNTQYGPIRPSYMAFLKAKRHLLLPERELQVAGTHLLTLLYGYAVIFTVLIVSALWWGYLSEV